MSLLEGFRGLDLLLLISALVGGLFFLLKTAMQFLGFDHDVDDSVPNSGHHHDSDLGFKVLSIQAISAFMMMFGLVGLACSLQFGLPVILSVPVAAVAGAISVWSMAVLFQVFGKLQSNGNFSLESLVGHQGTVYLTIPANGIGQVTVDHPLRKTEFDARTQNGLSLPTGSLVMVQAIQDGILIVSQHQESES